MGIKIILSRKGMDTSTGNLASPIFTDHKMVSLPIPILIEEEKQEEENSVYQKKYNDNLKMKNIDGVSSYSELINQISNSKIGNDWLYHFDPLIKNEENSISCFGQSEAAAKYLLNNLIKNKENKKLELKEVYQIPENETIVFLFFGRYHFVEKEGDKYVYTKFKKGKEAYKYKDLHLVWGYMVVDKIINMNNKYHKNQAEEFNYHPHSTNFYTKKNNNIIFVPKENKSKVLDFNERLILTNLNRDSNPISMAIWDKSKFANKDKFTTRTNSAIDKGESLFFKGRWQELVITDENVCQTLLTKLGLDGLLEKKES